jgi:hypothetical protein
VDRCLTTGRILSVHYECFEDCVLVETDVPFDLRHRRVLLYEYSPRGCKGLEGILKENMNAVLKEMGS